MEAFSPDALYQTRHFRFSSPSAFKFIIPRRSCALTSHRDYPYYLVFLENLTWSLLTLGYCLSRLLAARHLEGLISSNMELCTSLS